MHVIPDKCPLPPPFQGWPCVSWCRWSSAPADYSMSYDGKSTAVVGIRQAAVPPAHHQCRATLVSFTCQGMKPAIMPGVSHPGAQSIPNNPPPPLPLCLETRVSVHCCLRVISTYYWTKTHQFVWHPVSEPNNPWQRASFLKKKSCSITCSMIAVWLKAPVGLIQSRDFCNIFTYLQGAHRGSKAVLKGKRL